MSRASRASWRPAEAPCERLPGATVGVAPHSLRAVTPEELSRGREDRARRGHSHPHRRADARKSRTASPGPVAGPSSGCWRISAVDERWCLVHATHATEAEVSRVWRRAVRSSGCVLSPRRIWAMAFFRRRRSWSRAAGSASARIPTCCSMGPRSFASWSIPSASRIARVTCWRPLRAESTGRSLFDAALAGGAAGAEFAGYAASTRGRIARTSSVSLPITRRWRNAARMRFSIAGFLRAAAQWSIASGAPA